MLSTVVTRPTCLTRPVKSFFQLYPRCAVRIAKLYGKRRRGSRRLAEIKEKRLYDYEKKGPDCRRRDWTPWTPPSLKRVVHFFGLLIPVTANISSGDFMYGTVGT